MKTFPILKLNTSVKKPADERIFTIAQYMGILSGAMGLMLVLYLSKSEIIEKKLVLYVPYFILFLLPYATAVLYWLSLKLDQKISDWYDEKQLRDIMKASVTTLILSFPDYYCFYSWVFLCSFFLFILHISGLTIIFRKYIVLQ